MLGILSFVARHRWSHLLALAAVALTTPGCCAMLSGGDCGGNSQIPPDQERMIRHRQARQQRDSDIQRLLNDDAPRANNPASPIRDESREVFGRDTTPYRAASPRRSSTASGGGRWSPQSGGGSAPRSIPRETISREANQRDPSDLPVADEGVISDAPPSRPGSPSGSEMFVPGRSGTSR